MQVKDLIKELEKLDPEMHLLQWNPDIKRHQEFDFYTTFILSDVDDIRRSTIPEEYHNEKQILTVFAGIV